MKVTRSQRTAGLEVGGDANYVLGWNVGIMLQNIKRRVELSIIDRYLSPLPVGNFVGNIFNALVQFTNANVSALIYYSSNVELH